MKKINVIGTSGSGKSFFSQRLAKRLSVPYIEMDALFWQANWQGLETAKFIQILKQNTEQPGFVLDGNHSRTNAVKWQLVDTIIWLDLGFWRTFGQLLYRSFFRALQQREIWPNSGNKESFYRNFFTSHSVIWWMLKNYWKTKVKYRQLFKKNSQTSIQCIRLTSRADVERFLRCIEQNQLLLDTDAKSS